MKTSFLVSGCVFFAVAAVHGVEGAIYTEVDEMRDLDHGEASCKQGCFLFDFHDFSVSR